MLVKDEVITLISIDLKEGLAKASGKPYRFYVVTFADDEMNRLPATFARVEFADDVIPNWLFEAAEKKEKVTCTLEFLPKNFDISCKISNVSEV